ncbi:unnamed protein product [Fusarium graminearum]|uniref:Uncharacterized protein n=1 Tax=Gibberella zeae TaxID=5518 RepID=A0A9N8RER4_GIBZA|nr:unnamed protein product [Fusarium graminearum]
MSTQKQLTINEKKRKHGDVAGEILCQLEQYKEQELSPKSKRLCDKLYETADKIKNDSDNTDESLLESAFEVVQKKQKQVEDAENERKDLLKKLHDADDKCNSMTDKIESLEAQLKASDSQYKQEKVKYDNAKAELDEFDLLRSYGDWFAILIKRISNVEPAWQSEEKNKLILKYNKLNDAKKEQAKEEKKAEMAAKGEKFKGDFTYEKVDPSNLATIETHWSAMYGRENTEIDERVEAEKEKIAAWRAGGGGEEDAPATPFLDRIQILCNIYGIERQSICHRQPPVVEDYWKVTQNSEGKTVHVVLKDEHAEEGIEWSTFWDAFHSFRQDIQTRYTAGQIDIERRNLYIETINEYYALYSKANDEAGNPILTQYAKNKAKDKCQLVNGKPTEPPENAEKNYTEEKWDDL